MGRPAKATKTLAKHPTQDERDARLAIEEELRGADDNIAPPDWLNGGQVKVFEFVVTELAEHKLMGNIDVLALTAFAVATERLFDLEEKINTRVWNLDKDTIFARNSYIKDFWRGINEFSLSPQSRAKLGALNLAKKEEEKDPLKKLLAGKG